MMKIAFAFLAACLVTTLAVAQPYPSKPVRLVIPFPPGGSNDVVGRVIAAQLTERLGQTMVVENSGAGGGIVGINATAKSRADGYTLLLVSVGYPVSIALGRMPAESLQWFIPVATVATGPSLLVVPAATPVAFDADRLFAPLSDGTALLLPLKSFRHPPPAGPAGARARACAPAPSRSTATPATPSPPRSATAWWSSAAMPRLARASP